ETRCGEAPKELTIRTVQSEARGGSVMLGAAISWHSPGSLFVLDECITVKDYRTVLKDHLHPVVQTFYPEGGAMYQADNVIIHPAKLESWNLGNSMGMVCFLPGRTLISDTTASAQISACLVDISTWMAAHQLKFNPSKTELLIIPVEKDLYRLARPRERDGKVVQQVKVIKDRDGRVLTSEESVQRRWKEYFEELMNEENESEKRVEGVNSVEQKVDKIRKDEVRKALKRMKSGKAVGPDDIPVEVCV
ncbi:hypothetical protein QTP86_020037, partial [Hemibagrus guttatus]